VGDDRLLKADDAGQVVRLSPADALDQVLAHLLLDGQELVA